MKLVLELDLNAYPTAKQARTVLREMLNPIYEIPSNAVLEAPLLVRPDNEPHLIMSEIFTPGANCEDPDATTTARAVIMRAGFDNKNYSILQEGFVESHVDHFEA